MAPRSNSPKSGRIRHVLVKFVVCKVPAKGGQSRSFESSFRVVTLSRPLRPSVRVISPSRSSESSIRVVCASSIWVVCTSHCLVDCKCQRESESSVRVAVCAAVKGRRSESLFRVICPSRRSESSVRDAIPSHPFRLSLRVAFQVAVPSCHSAIPSRLYGPHSELSVRAVVPSYNVCPAVLPGRQSASVAGGAGTCESVRVIPSRQSESHGTCGHGRLSDARAPQSGPG